MTTPQVPRYTVLRVTAWLARITAAGFLAITVYTLFFTRYSASAYAATALASLALGGSSTSTGGCASRRTPLRPSCKRSAT